MSLDAKIRRRREKIRMSELFVEPRASAFKRIPSTNELEDAMHKHIGGIFVCVHNRHYFTTCEKCKRTQQDADKQFEYYKQHCV